MICLLLILCWILISSTVFAAEENTRAAYFRTRENKRLPGYVVRSFASPSLMSCSHSCLRNSWCTSTNFKEAFKQGDKGTCELNKHEIVSINKDTQLVEQQGVTFSVFLKDCRLNGCFNGGSCLFDEKKETFSCSCKPLWNRDKSVLAQDCFELYRDGVKRDGVYKIKPDCGSSFEVFCDQTTSGGGWTVFQKRLDGSVDFYRGWDDYKRGFGNLSGEFWLGLEKIHRLTKQRGSRLRVDLEDFNGAEAFAEYGYFGVASEKEKYKLSLGSYNGTAGDSFSHHHGANFSTKDRDNDGASSNCAQSHEGAWWYKACHYSNLNGRYLNGKHSSHSDGVIWEAWKGYLYSVKRAEMKLKPINGHN